MQDSHPCEEERSTESKKGSCYLTHTHTRPICFLLPVHSLEHVPIRLTWHMSHWNICRSGFSGCRQLQHHGEEAKGNHSPHHSRFTGQTGSQAEEEGPAPQ